MKQYITPEMELVLFSKCDILTTSEPFGSDDNVGDFDDFFGGEGE